LLVCELLSQTRKTLSALVEERISLFPCSGEINFKVMDVKDALARVEFHFLKQAPLVDKTDGLSMDFENWRFNLRGSNTEPLLRLNVESRADAELVASKVEELSKLINGD